MVNGKFARDPIDEGSKSGQVTDGMTKKDLDHPKSDRSWSKKQTLTLHFTYTCEGQSLEASVRELALRFIKM